MRSFIFVALSAASVVSALTNFTIDPNAIDATKRSNWCNAQTNTCGMLCNPTANDCDPSTLSYVCTCQNGSAPGLAYYIQTIPTFVCEEAFDECNAANAGNAQGQKNCTTSIKDQCGTLDPSNYSAPAASSSSAAPSSTPAATSTAATVASSAPTTSSSTAGAVPTAIAHLGNGAAAVALGVFAYLL